MKRIYVAALAALTLASCASPEKNSGPQPTRRSIEEDIIAQVRSVTPAYPEGAITFEITDDWTVACGTFSVPGRMPLVFMSLDSEPHDNDRSVVMPPLLDEEVWDIPALPKQAAANLRICQENGLLQ